MNHKTNETANETKSFNLNPLLDFLTDVVKPLELAKTLDTIELEYSMLLFDSPKTISEETSENVNLLHQLKEILKTVYE